MPTVINPPQLAALVTILTQLYPAEADMWRLLDWIDLPIGHVIFTGKAYNRWHSAAREAMLQGKLLDLVTIAAQEYPANKHLPYFVTILKPEPTHGK